MEASLGGASDPETMTFRPPDPSKRVPYDDPNVPGGVLLVAVVLLCLAVGGYFLLGVIEALAIVLVRSIIGGAFYVPWKLRQTPHD